MICCCLFKHISEILQIVSYVVGGVGIFIAAKTYKNNRELKKAEWLKSLFEKFYENDSYKAVRQWLDYNTLTSEDLAKDINKEEQLADFLNFFEFIGMLYKTKQLTLHDIKGLFAYYLKLINNSEICRKFANDYEYKNLENLLRDSSKNES